MRSRFEDESGIRMTRIEDPAVDSFRSVQLAAGCVVYNFTAVRRHARQQSEWMKTCANLCI